MELFTNQTGTLHIIIIIINVFRYCCGEHLYYVYVANFCPLSVGTTVIHVGQRLQQ